MDRRKDNIKGTCLIVTSIILWAINGNIGSYLFKNKEVTPEHLTLFRLVFSGVILLSYQYIKNKKEIFKIFNDKREALRLLYFTFFGLLAMQYGYFVAVKYSNAATATILQALTPFIIVLLVSIQSRSYPAKNIILALLFAFIGAFFLITHGKLNQLAITTIALVSGLIGTFGAVNYNLSPRVLQKKYSTGLIISWAMLIAGLGFGIVARPLRTNFIIDISSIFGILYVIVFGTLFPFLFFLMGSKIIGPQRAGIISLIEPVASTIIGVVFLGESFLSMDYLGISMILFALLVLNMPEKALVEVKEIPIS